MTLEDLEALLVNEDPEARTFFDPRRRQDIDKTAPLSPFATTLALESVDLPSAATNVLHVMEIVSHLAHSVMTRNNPFPQDVALLQALDKALATYRATEADSRLAARHARLLDGITDVYERVVGHWPQGARTTSGGWEDAGITTEQQTVECWARTRLDDLLETYLPELNENDRFERVQELVLTGPEIRCKDSAVHAACEQLSAILPEPLKRSARTLAKLRDDSPLLTTLALQRPQHSEPISPDEVLKRVQRAQDLGERLAHLAVPAEKSGLWADEMSAARRALRSEKDRAEAEKFRSSILGFAEATLEECDRVDSLSDLKASIRAFMKRMREAD